MSELIRYPHNADKSEIAQTLKENGCVVVADLIDPHQRQAMIDELAPVMEVTRVIEEDDPEEFYPGHTRRATGLVARSETVTDLLIPHPVSQAVCETTLLPASEFGYQIHVTAALEVGPGAREQLLHREEDSFTYFPCPRPNLITASMWAMSDFRADNGATSLVPGSHLWPEDRRPEPDEVIQAEMTAGSVLYWMGGLLHGAGPNTSEDWRYGIILTYSAGWVRQEENQYLNVPVERMKALSPEVRKVVGFDMYRALGLYDPSLLDGR